MLTIPRETKASETSYDRAIANAARMLADESQLWAGRISLYVFSVWSETKPGVMYRVELAPGGKLEGAKCNCQGSDAEACKHRGVAHLKFQEWLETDQGYEWADGYYCAKCRQQPKLPGQECCRQCAPVAASAQVAKDFDDIFGVA